MTVLPSHGGGHSIPKVVGGATRRLGPYPTPFLFNLNKNIPVMDKKYDHLYLQLITAAEQTSFIYCQEN